MKLTKIQISALVDKIYNQIKNSVEDYNNKLEENPILFNTWKKNNKELVSSIENSINSCKKLKELIDSDCPYHIKYAADLNIKEELQGFFRETLTLKSYPAQHIIENDIILETIECEDIDSIISKLVDKYTK